MINNSKINMDYEKVQEKIVENFQILCGALKKFEQELPEKFIHPSNEEFVGYLIDLKEYEQFKKAIEYDTYVNDINKYKEKIEPLLFDADKLKKLKCKKIDSVDELLQLLKHDNEYKLINKELWDADKDEKSPDASIKYSINDSKLKIIINNQSINFKGNENIISIKYYEAIPNISKETTMYTKITILITIIISIIMITIIIRITITIAIMIIKL